ncbi:hypothetical protein LOTGIDRAFT_228160 [Lottia gigantea]|uniref:Integrin beta subunit tail domain-containing protein n=1 Tax=Lottia gigantea TaxID=225164 RepID=V4BD05_LOTGI|nr:hypothetical protein LOTGIDRAFT_228160 [Lottia gigantea]ESP05686.1 hypothetical protein LOTGIDRAFT_228160 [Lottia gigantea]
MDMDYRLLRNEPLSTMHSKRIAPQQISLNIKKASGKETEVQFEATAAKRWLATKISFPRRKYSITMTSTCRFRWRDSGRGRCSRTRRGQTLTFTLKIRVLDCNDGNGRITVSIPGYTQDKLNIEIRSSCPCSCEQNKERNSAVCRGNGHLSCGTCECSDGYFGQQCECMGYERDTCRARPDSTVCSGRGNCVCGMCECQAGFEGQHCECNNENCNWFNNSICGGSDHGICNCGECTCKPEYTGTACELPMSTDGCIAPNGIICNGHGNCIGNTCQCRGTYRGRTCDQCPTCIGQCSILWPCIQCTIFQTGELTREDCYYQCRQYGIMPVDSLERRESSRLCMFRDDDNCSVSFMYMFDEDGELVVEASRQKNCARQ